MAKTAIADAYGNEYVKPVPAIKNVRPVGTQILVELLTPNEIMGTNLALAGGGGVSGAPQAYVLDIGPKVDPGWGIVIGDRVVLSGQFTPLPEAAAKNGRALGVVEPQMIKAILLEK